MSYQYKFARLLALKEREKKEALTDYQSSVKSFEEVAEKLYELLKKKEDLEIYQSDQLQKGLSVVEIKQHQQFLSNLEKSINRYQKMVINARNRMSLYQEKLMHKNVEVKKFEKIREKDFEHFFEEMKAIENRQMDDISIQHYVNRGS